MRETWKPILFTQEELKKVLHYDPITGIFTWTKKVARCVKVGKIAGSKSTRSIKIRIFSKFYQAHRIAWFYMTGEQPLLLIDHINGDPYDNRFENLRLATHAENSRNKIGKSSSGFKGVYKYNAKNNQKYGAQICVDGKRIHLGLFENPKDAYAAYCEAAKKYHKNFAKLS